VAESRRENKGKIRGESRGNIRVKGRGESRLRRENSGESKADESTENGPRIDPDACMRVCMHACSPIHGLSSVDVLAIVRVEGAFLPKQRKNYQVNLLKYCISIA
jgi:hypothetical protein